MALDGYNITGEPTKLTANELREMRDALGYNIVHNPGMASTQVTAFMPSLLGHLYCLAREAEESK